MVLSKYLGGSQNYWCQVTLTALQDEQLGLVSTTFVYDISSNNSCPSINRLPRIITPL